MATTPNVSLTQLSKVVDQAVKAALQRNNVKATAPFTINPGILAGPILDAAVNLEVAQRVAEQVTQQVQQAQAGAGQQAAGAAAQTLQSGVLITGNHIICGFFPPGPPWELNVDTKQ